MIRNIAFGVKAGVMLTTYKATEFRHYKLCQTSFQQKIKRNICVTADKHLGQFASNTFCADILDKMCVTNYRIESIRLKHKFVHGTETNCAKHSQRILIKTIIRISNATQNAIVQVNQTVNMINHISVFVHQ